MIAKFIPTLLLFVLLTCCSTDTSNISESLPADNQNALPKDTVIEIKLKPSGIELFIDSMKTAHYHIDTNRLKQVTWSFLDKHPKIMNNGYAVIKAPFPVEEYQGYFSDPKTYFFANWNETEKTFKNGNDYLLMTWTIDSAGIKKEKEIYSSLHGIMGNFPCYIFRSNNKVYAMCHRMTVYATQTRKLTEQLRCYIDNNSLLYSPFGGREPK